MESNHDQVRTRARALTVEITEGPGVGASTAYQHPQHLFLKGARSMTVEMQKGYAAP